MKNWISKKSIIYFEEIYSSLLKSITIEDIENNEHINRIHSELDILKEQLSTYSQTATLWINYQKVITIIKKLIRAARLGQWNLNLEALQESLPIFAAAGHSNYVKSAYLYLQTMLDLENTHNKVFIHFTNGGF